jgi:SAM-dependent methyltransferase
MRILNLGCGTKISTSSDVVNIDWSIQLRIRRSALLSLFAPVLLNRERLSAFRSLADNILVYDLSKGIPFPDSSVDVVYHSHTLEYLDRDVVPKFFAEVKRVLKNGGIHRIVVPDFEKLCIDYCNHLKDCEESPSEIGKHDLYVSQIIEQSVRKEPTGTSRQGPIRRFIENALLGDARKRGQTHQWMWDRFNLQQALSDAGFRSITRRSYNESQIVNWDQYGLDRNGSEEYKPGSLYMEAIK